MFRLLFVCLLDSLRSPVVLVTVTSFVHNLGFHNDILLLRIRSTKARPTSTSTRTTPLLVVVVVVHIHHNPFSRFHDLHDQSWLLVLVRYNTQLCHALLSAWSVHHKGHLQVGRRRRL